MGAVVGLEKLGPLAGAALQEVWMERRMPGAFLTCHHLLPTSNRDSFLKTGVRCKRFILHDPTAGVTPVVW